MSNLVLGYVVNIHDAINYDIDIEIPYDSYPNVVSREYDYIDNPSLSFYTKFKNLCKHGFLKDNESKVGFKVNSNDNDVVKTSIAYRCRLYGIHIIQGLLQVVYLKISKAALLKLSYYIINKN